MLTSIEYVYLNTVGTSYPLFSFLVMTLKETMLRIRNAGYCSMNFLKKSCGVDLGKQGNPMTVVDTLLMLDEL